MKRTFCTLFDHNYLYKGLALYSSLEKHCPDYTLWILAMSDIAYETLRKLKLKNVKLIRLKDFEDDELLKIKPTRSVVEYFWTLTPSLPLYVLSRDTGIDSVTYVDADCFFFSDPEPIFEELGRDSVLIIEHRYADERKDWEKTAGRFNVELLIFKRDDIGLKVLKRWREQCNEWCYYREEEGKFGDQMYLNSWPEDYSGVHILAHKGSGLAPWNIKNYEIHQKKGLVYVDSDPLVFYHFHALKMYSLNNFELASGYNFLDNEKKLVYDPYLEELGSSFSQVNKIDDKFSCGFTPKAKLRSRIYDAISIIKGKLWAKSQ